MRSRVLLVEEDPARAQRIGKVLADTDIESFHTTGAREAEEALGIRQFDVVLFSSAAKPAETAREIQSMSRRLCPSGKFIVWGKCDASVCDAIVPEDVPEPELGRALVLAQQRAAANSDDRVSQLPVFDLTGFGQQMGDDPELMREIVEIFFEESEGQMRDLNETLASGDTTRAARLAHSLKGSLASLHAARARHWAQTVESAAASGDPNASQAALVALSRAIDELTPALREVLS
jgi:HPt (histidine-containing phosphotransfer) domain-containing protein